MQGKHGVVVRLDGVFSVPDVAYHCDGTRDEPTYSVRFESTVLWGEPGDPVHVDVWESYLETADAMTTTTIPSRTLPSRTRVERSKRC